MAEGKLFSSYCRRWNSGIKPKLLIFQKFSGDVNTSFGYLLGGTDELGHLRDFLCCFLARLRIFPVLSRISVGVEQVGLNALSLTAAFLVQCFSCLFFFLPKPLTFIPPSWSSPVYSVLPQSALVPPGKGSACQGSYPAVVQCFGKSSLKCHKQFSS